MYENVRAYVRKKGMLEKRDRVIAGVSGGADSICLLCMLLDLAGEFDLDLVAVHVNHGLRGAEAQADEEYVKAFCSQRNVILEVYHVDVKAVAGERKLTQEEAGREIRRECFADAVRKHGGTKIALAHHMNDDVETLFLNLARGTGLKGIGGMRAVNGMYIRPLLCMKRKEIEAYLEKNSIKYCIDSTNLEDSYTRNRIRNHVIPYMEQHINEKTVEHTEELMEQMCTLQEYVEEQICSFYDKCVTEGADCAVIERKAYEEVPEALRAYLLQKVLNTVSGKEKDIRSIHIKSVLGLWEKQVGRRISLPYEMTAKRCYEGIKIFIPTQRESQKREVKFRIMERTGVMDTFPKNPYTKWFDYDIIESNVIMRTRCPGDYITIDDQGNTQSLKKYFINQKIPKEKRDQILLAADGNHIMWIAGYRQNQKYQVTEHTRRILEIQIDGGEKDGRIS